MRTLEKLLVLNSDCYCEDRDGNAEALDSTNIFFNDDLRSHPFSRKARIRTGLLKVLKPRLLV